jgi:hypothetical protein
MRVASLLLLLSVTPVTLARAEIISISCNQVSGPLQRFPSFIDAEINTDLLYVDMKYFNDKHEPAGGH